MKASSGWIVLFVGLVIMGFFFSLHFSPIIYVIIAFFAYLIADAVSKSTPGQSEEAQYEIPNYLTAAQVMQSAATAPVKIPEHKMTISTPSNLKCPSCGASITPNDKKCAFCGSSLQPQVDLPEPLKLGDFAIGDTVWVTYAQFNEMPYNIRGRLLYTELWQATRGADVPWTPTGNHFSGFVLNQESYLLNWQSRFYLLSNIAALNDSDINRDFLPYAKQFAQSNQSAHVEFSYGGLRWQIDDIGRFAIESVEGEGAHLSQGAIGRFIHCSSGDMALVIEDFQSGGSGGQDTLWKGYQIKESNIHK